MKVKELIEILSRFDPNFDVHITAEAGCIAGEPIKKDINTEGNRVVIDI